MTGPRRPRWIVLLVVMVLGACRPATVRPQAPEATPTLLVPTTLANRPTLTPKASSTAFPAPAQTLSVTPSPIPSRPAVSASPSGPVLDLSYTLVDEPTTGRIRGRLYFPSEFVPSLAVYAVATDGSRFYRVDTQSVPPGEPDYEIGLVEPGTYYVYAYPAQLPSPDHSGADTEGNEDLLGGSYSLLAACEAGRSPPPPEGCWENPQHDLVPVEVRAGQAVEEINVFDWYGPPLPRPPDDTGGWPTYADEQAAYRLRYPPHWQVQSERQGEVTLGLPARAGEGVGREFASVRVTTGDPEELADQLIASLPPGDVVLREWRPFAGRDSLCLVLGLPEGRFAWWFVPRYELVYVVHAVTDSGRGSFDQVLQTFVFVE